VEVKVVKHLMGEKFKLRFAFARAREESNSEE
jgi:hypothetical protein